MRKYVKMTWKIELLVGVDNWVVLNDHVQFVPDADIKNSTSSTNPMTDV